MTHLEPQSVSIENGGFAFGISGEDLCNFAAGPAALPKYVKDQLWAAIDPVTASRNEITPFWVDKITKKSVIPGDTLPVKLPILETSHRSHRVEWIIQDTETLLKHIIFGGSSLKDDFSCLFLQGGASLQFSTILMNLFPSIYGNKSDASCVIGDYIVTGTWSLKAYDEAAKLGISVNSVLGQLSFPRTGLYKLSLEEFQKSMQFSRDSRFIYFCHNETIQGFKIPYEQILKDELSNRAQFGKISICDMSSSILTEPVDMSLFDVVFASCQKNLGIPGVTVVLIRKNLCHGGTPLPTMLDFSVHAKANSAYNTPPVLALYSVNAMLRYIASNFDDLESLLRFHRELAERLYSAIDCPNSCFKPVVSDPRLRSLTNICWDIKDQSQVRKFIELASSRNIIEIGGHRSVGGFRASLYNGISEKAVKSLVDVLKNFHNVL